MAIYKDKKRNTWYFRDYVDNEYGKRVQVERSGFSSKFECREYERYFLSNYGKDKQLKEEIKKEQEISHILFRDLYKSYMQLKKQELKYQSFRSLENRFQKHILPYFKDKYVDEITMLDYVDWKTKILSYNYSFTYMSSLHQAMVNILNYGMKFYKLKENVATQVGNFSRKNYYKKINFWTYDEFNNFISVIDDIVYFSFFDLLYYTGLRLGEALALTWHDFNNNIINVDKTLIRKSVNNCLFNPPKSKSSIREIKIDNFVVDNLLKLKEYYKKFIGFNDDWFIFGGIKPLGTTTVTTRKNNYCKLAKVKQIKIHDFRHSHATFLLSNGVPPTVIQKRLGHAKLSMTLDIYAHFIKNDEDKAIEFLNNLKFSREF